MKKQPKRMEDAVLRALREDSPRQIFIDEGQSQISIILHIPVKMPEFGNAYACKFEVFDESPFSQFALGEDAAQAFRLALHIVEASIGKKIPIDALYPDI